MRLTLLLPPLPLPSAMLRGETEEIGQILLITPHHTSRHRTPHRCRMKILTGIQKQNSHLSLVFCEGERHERGQCCDSTALIIQESKDSERCRGAAAAGTDAHAKTMRGVQTESEANG